MGLINTGMTKMRPDLPYMTGPELILFDPMREGGAISIFRCGSCAQCKRDIRKEKLFCSKRCYDAPFQRLKRALQEKMAKWRNPQK